MMPQETWNMLSSSLNEIVDKARLVDGIFVECGSYFGTTAKILCKAAEKKLYLFDSWEGLPEPSEYDNLDFYKKGSWNCSLDEARNNLNIYKNVIFMKGWFPDRFEEIKDEKISLLHLDCSLYESTKKALYYFWEQMSPGGYIICNYHDGYSKGPQKAFEDFFKDLRTIQNYPTGLAVVIK